MRISKISTNRVSAMAKSETELMKEAGRWRIQNVRPVLTADETGDTRLRHPIKIGSESTSVNYILEIQYDTAAIH